MIALDLGFRMNKFNKYRQSMRDQNLINFYNGSDEMISELLQSNWKNACIDPLHSINTFNFCAHNPNHTGFQQFVRFGKPYIKDSNGRGPAEILMDMHNIRGMRHLFDMVIGKEM